MGRVRWGESERQEEDRVLWFALHGGGWLMRGACFVDTGMTGPFPAWWATQLKSEVAQPATAAP